MRVITVGDLLAHDRLRDGTVIGGRTGLDAAVHDVMLVVTGPELGDAPYGTAAVFDLGGATSAYRRDHLVEIVCRRLHARNGRLLVVAGGPFDPALSTVRLTDRLGLPVVAAPDVAPPVLTAELLALVHAPQVAVGRRLATGAARLRTTGSLDEVLAVLDSLLDARTSLSTADGTVLAGRAPRHAVPTPTEPAVPIAERDGQVSTALCPVPGTDDSRLWMISQCERTGPLWRDAALGLLDIAVPYAAAWFAAERLTAERDARVRGELLTQILGHEGPLPRHLAGQAARLGWRLHGWHSGIHFTLIGTSTPAPVTVTAVLTNCLRAHGLEGRLVEQAGGWSGWHTDEAPAADSATITEAVERALADYHGAANGPPIVAGIGRASAGPTGLALTLTDARNASLVAAATKKPGTVQHSEHLGTKRMLLDWYGSSTARQEAEQMLAPLLRHGREALLETVECYLDTGCSASAAAQRLGLHRNTVTRRIQRAEALLGTPLSDPDDRLSLQLACRLYRLARD
ncbi:helix-turn-helix domain-containing protein [Actinomadura sp. NPDC047616]|uniref:PucR family transcriptional regulator n=1 Tax=Actinomadura sp. NPDC047616 TaxID=3155914 RepID=UPI0033F7DC57